MKQTAIKQSYDAAESEWKHKALAAVKRAAKRQRKLTTDDVWQSLRDLPIAEPRAMGGVMQKAQAEGWISPTQEIKQSTRGACHCRPLRVWESLL